MNITPKATKLASVPCNCPIERNSFIGIEEISIGESNKSYVALNNPKQFKKFR